MKKAFFRDRYLRTAFLLTILLFGVAVFVALSVSREAGVLIIHFTDRGTLDFFGSSGDVLGIVGAGFSLSVINIFLAYFLYDRQRTLSRLLFFFNLLIGTLILISVGVIVSIN